MKTTQTQMQIIDIDVETEIEQTTAEVIHEIMPDIERRSHVRAFDDLA